MIALAAAEAHPADFVGAGAARDFADVDELSAGIPRIGSEPRLDDQHAAGPGVTRHAGDRAIEPRGRFDVTDRAEQAGDGVVGAAEIEIRHVALSIVA